MSKSLITITEDKALAFIQELVGNKISHVWRGYGTAIFIEIGTLAIKDDEQNPSGKFTIAIEGTWRIDESGKIILCTDDDDAELNKIIKILKNLSITNLQFFARSKEIDVQFDNNFWLSSFEMISSDLRWSIKNGTRWLYYKSNKFVIEEVL